MVIKINRLRMRNMEPIAIETVWIPYYMFRDMTREMIDNKSLYNIFRTKYKCFPSKAKQTIEPTKVNDYEASLLGLKNESLALLFRRTTFDEKERPIEYTKSIYRSDNYRYEVILT
nr:UTRA domain-containing protein [Clostridium ljungdahlii]